ncbi:MAG: hypothetical protein SPK63_01850 [Eubacteriales bacterium]|nr:hypothetical protein [Eubacteriales bacterium]
MKTKKLTLSSGILLVIAASLSIFGLIAVVEALVKTLLFTPVNVEGNREYVLTYLIVSIYQICLYIAQGIVYMIFGVKMIKRSTPTSEGKANKKILIASLVCVSCSLIFDPVEIMKLLFVALIPVIACALSFDTKVVEPVVEKPVYLYGTNKNGKDLGGVNLDDAGNVVSDKPYAVVDKFGKVEYVGGTQNNVANVQTASDTNVKVSAQSAFEPSNAQLNESKLATLAQLKNSGVISESEYNEFVSKVVSNQTVKVNADKPEDIKVPNKSRVSKVTKTTTRKTTTKKPQTKDKKIETSEENK